MAPNTREIVRSSMMHIVSKIHVPIGLKYSQQFPEEQDHEQAGIVPPFARPGAAALHEMAQI